MFNEHCSIVNPKVPSHGSRVKLDQERIVAEALALVDADGLAAFNMRALAKRLGVQASALYWHVGGKDELVTLMANGFFRQAMTEVPEGLSWRAWLMAFGHALRRALVAHRDSAMLCALALPPEGGIEAAADILAAPLMDGGLTREQALMCEASVISLTVGWTLYEQSKRLHDFLAELVGFERSYATGLEALVRGLPEGG
jgi:TetR/AcrR family tetracycline transcriptional repressor